MFQYYFATEIPSDRSFLFSLYTHKLTCRETQFKAKLDQRHHAIKHSLNEGPCFGAKDLCLDLDDRKSYTYLNSVYSVPNVCPGPASELFTGSVDTQLNDVEVLVESGLY